MFPTVTSHRSLSVPPVEFPGTSCGPCMHSPRCVGTVLGVWAQSWWGKTLGVQCQGVYKADMAVHADCPKVGQHGSLEEERTKGHGGKCPGSRGQAHKVVQGRKGVTVGPQHRAASGKGSATSITRISFPVAGFLALRWPLSPKNCIGCTVPGIAQQEGVCA